MNLIAFNSISSMNLTSNEFKFNNLNVWVKKDIKEIDDTGEYLEWVIGRINVERFFSNPYFYSIVNKNGKSEIDLSLIFKQISVHYQSIIYYLWFIKDNACNTETAYFLSTDPLIDDYSKMESILERFSNSSGNYSQENISEADLQEAQTLLDEYTKKITDLHPNKVNKVLEQSVNAGHANGYYVGYSNFVEYNLGNRIDKAMQKLREARSSSKLPVKISFYISVLEALFYTKILHPEKPKINHRISCRSAKYICSFSGDNLLDLYKFIKIAYGIRSEYFHGRTFINDDYNHLINISKRLDDIIRKLFRKIFDGDYSFFKQKESLFINWINGLTNSDAEIT